VDAIGSIRQSKTIAACVNEDGRIALIAVHCPEAVEVGVFASASAAPASSDTLTRRGIPVTAFRAWALIQADAAIIAGVLHVAWAARWRVSDYIGIHAAIKAVVAIPAWFTS
jgi:hypothetical protein